MVRLRPIVLLFWAMLVVAQAPQRAGPVPVPATSLATARSELVGGDFRAAAAAYQLIVEKSPSLAEAQAGLVHSLLKLDEVDAAEQATRDALQVLPQSPLVLATDGDVKFRRGLLEDARDRYKAAIHLDAKCARAWLGMGRIDAVESHRKQSRQAFERAHDLDPNDGDILYYWALGLPFPQNVAALQKHMAEFHDDAEKERHEREYIDFLQALNGRKVWILARPVPQTEIKLQPVVSRVQDGPRAFSLKVKLNGRVSANVMLDTGASGLTISRKLAEKAHATMLSEHSLEGVGNSGPAKGYEAWVDKVAIGDLEFHDCHVHVSSRDNPDYDGLIGTDVFEDYLVSIDFPSRTLRLEPMPAEANNDFFTPFYRFGHIMLMPTSVGDTAHGLFALDTGSSTNSMSPGMARSVSTVRSSNIPVNGMSGSVSNVFTADQTVLQFSRFVQPHENIITFDLHGPSKDLGTEISGLIGFATLKKMTITIDYRDGMVGFDYKP
ncbi:MAG TPA: aspartyl protease family protein [Candidatus Angelobacter sp.]|nr:aspartyl protease family protein [Candidatus Angelobacter sp.]